MGMIKAGNNFGFTFETLAAGGIVREIRGKNLDGNNALQARIPCPIHLAHATGAQRREDFVGT